jgi:hypothetical protein
MQNHARCVWHQAKPLIISATNRALIVAIAHDRLAQDTRLTSQCQDGGSIKYMQPKASFSADRNSILLKWLRIPRKRSPR